MILEESGSVADGTIWVSPLAAIEAVPFTLPNGAMSLEDRSGTAKFSLRGDTTDSAFAAAVQTALGVALPLESNQSNGDGKRTLLWLGPDEWLLVCPAEDGGAAEAALTEARLVFTPVGEGRATIRLSGPRAVDVLRKGTSLNVHPGVFQPGHCAQTLLEQAAILIHRLAEPVGYDIYCERSVAEYLWRWLEDSAQEFRAD